MNEHSFIRSIHNYLDPDVYKWKIHDTYTGGIPDCMYAGPAGVLFVEYKYIRCLPKRDSTVLGHSLSKLQCQWLERMRGCTNTALILGAGEGALILIDDFSANISKMNYIERSISRQAVAKWIYDVTHGGGNYEKTSLTTSSHQFKKTVEPAKT